MQHRFNLLGVDCSSEEFSKFTMPKILNKRGNDRSTNLFINGPVNAMCVNVLIRIFYTISRSDLKLSLCSNGVNLEIPWVSCFKIWLFKSYWNKKHDIKSILCTKYFPSLLAFLWLHWIIILIFPHTVVCIISIHSWV